MIKMISNEKNINVKMTRHELIDLLLLCAAHEKDAEKWGTLHNKLYDQLKSYDEKHLDEEV